MSSNTSLTHSHVSTSFPCSYSSLDWRIQCNCGASLALPVVNLYASVVVWCMLVLSSKYFVYRSAGLSLPRTFSYLNLPFAATSCIHKCPVSMCLVCPKPRLFIIPNAALSSPHSSPFVHHPRSLSTDIVPNPSAEAFNAAYNSDSPELKAINDWVLDKPLTVCSPIFIHPPRSGLTTLFTAGPIGIAINFKHSLFLLQLVQLLNT